MVTLVTWPAVSTAVPVALTRPPPPPPGKLNVTVGAVVYVPALAVIVTEVTFRRSTAVPAAPVPPPPALVLVNVTPGTLVKPAPPLVTLTEATPEPPRFAVPVAVVPPAGAAPKVTVGAVV